MTEKMRELEIILSRSQILDVQDTLKHYSSDLSSFDPDKMPSLVLKPKNISEVQKIVKFSNKIVFVLLLCSGSKKLS